MTKFGAMPFRFDAEGKFVFGKARLVSSEIRSEVSRRRDGGDYYRRGRLQDGR